MSMSFGLQDMTPQLDGVVAELRKMPGRHRRGMTKGLEQHGEAVFAKSQALVPIGGPPTSPKDPHPGLLKSTGVMRLSEDVNGEAVLEISYGATGTGADAYAWRQHEDLTFRHKPGQTAKFLERPMLEEMDKLRSRIIGAIREELGT